MAANSASENSHRSPETLENLEFPPNKRPKLLTLNSPSSSSFKGKSEVQDESKSSCGICFLEEGKAVRGWIDCCQHCFCFVCIMEWAKVESRCPLCKRRFSTIRRPPMDGVFLSQRVVNVPVRDQVEHYSGNATAQPSDPYSEVQCTVCHNSSDDSLLLLCDLCDSASHTYCVGFGATVPEGDWFCQDCNLMREEYAKSDKDPDCGNQASSDSDCGIQTNLGNFNNVPSAESHVSIIDIVRESSFLETLRPSYNRTRSSSSIVPNGGVSVENDVIEQGSRAQPIPERSTYHAGPRTLRHCRNIHGHIRALRENWNEFRRGSMSFSSSSINSPIGVALHGSSGRPNSSSFSSQQSMAQNGSSSNVSHNRGNQYIDKAWKMMNVAMSLERDSRKIRIGHQASEHPLRKISFSKEAGNVTSKILTSNRKLGDKDHMCIKLEKHHQDCASEQDNHRPKFLVFEKEKQSGALTFVQGYPATCSQGYCELPSLVKVKNAVHIDIFHGNGGNLPHKPSDVLIKVGPSCLNSVPVTSNRSRAKQERHVSSSCNLEEKTKVGNSCVDSKARRDNDAKSEIQSLVKLNLKLLSKDKKLEVDAFKEVARHATHSILAACGIEQLKRGVRSFPSSGCCHVDEGGQQLRRSTLMPKSCRECFFAFVKDVVNTIMFEKIGCA